MYPNSLNLGKGVTQSLFGYFGAKVSTIWAHGAFYLNTLNSYGTLKKEPLKGTYVGTYGPVP